MAVTVASLFGVEVDAVSAVCVVLPVKGNVAGRNAWWLSDNYVWWTRGIIIPKGHLSKVHPV